jgi:hypothetical protein
MEDVRPSARHAPAEWKPEARDEVFDYFLLRHAPFQEARKALARLEEEREACAAATR